MTDHAPLRLHEEVLLLALNDEKGTVHFGASFDQAAAGAILAELLLSERLRMEGEKKKARVVVKDETPLDEPLLDECLSLVAGESKKKKPVEWVQKFARIKRFKHRVAEGLVDRGILKEDEDKVLFVFNRTIYPEVDSRPEQEIIRRIRHAVSGSGSVEARTSVLIALAKHTGLLKRAVDKHLLKDGKERVDQLVKGELAANATKEAVEAMQAAVMVAVMIPAITASTTASH